jgi:hypothetical protein
MYEVNCERESFPGSCGFQVLGNGPGGRRNFGNPTLTQSAQRGHPPHARRRPPWRTRRASAPAPRPPSPPPGRPARSVRTAHYVYVPTKYCVSSVCAGPRRCCAQRGRWCLRRAYGGTELGAQPLARCTQARAGVAHRGLRGARSAAYGVHTDASFGDGVKSEAPLAFTFCAHLNQQLFTAGAYKPGARALAAAAPQRKKQAAVAVRALRFVCGLRMVS